MSESIKALEALREYVAQGYVLHGSKSMNQMLEPRQARDTNRDRVSGQSFAIYATDHVEIPLFMALKDRKDPNVRSMRSGYNGTGGKFHLYGENTTLTPGFVYVLPRDTFEVESDGNGDEELISRVPVTPVAIIRVEPDILNLFDNITLDLQ
jgi:hypothetical protein